MWAQLTFQCFELKFGLLAFMLQVLELCYGVLLVRIEERIEDGVDKYRCCQEDAHFDVHVLVVR